MNYTRKILHYILHYKLGMNIRLELLDFGEIQPTPIKRKRQISYSPTRPKSDRTPTIAGSVGCGQTSTESVGDSLTPDKERLT